MSDPFKIERLTSRPQFLAAAKGVSEARGAVVVQRLDREDDTASVGLGFTATRKVGNAVIRNRAKRRLRELFRAHQKQLPAQCDYLLIARAAMTQRPFPELEKNFLAACTQISAAVAKLPHG
jgi:ribonuclease P protein component